MKSTLLTTTAVIVAFAGAAYADGHTSIDFSGSATLGVNDDPQGDHQDFYADMNLDVTMKAMLDNGISVTATADADELDASDAAFTGVTLEIASETMSLTYGDTDPSADKHWSGVDGDTVGAFNDRDAHLDGATPLFDAIVRGEATLGDITASVSAGANSTQDATSTAPGANDALQAAAVADVAGITLIGAYQDGIAGTAGDDSAYGVSAAMAVAGIDLMGSYIAEAANETSSIGVSASMPVGPVTVGGYYSVNDSDAAASALDAFGADVSFAQGAFSASADVDMVEDADATWEVDTNYDTGFGLIVHAGVVDSGDDYYVAGTYDLGGDASLLVSYVEDGGDANGDDEIGEDDLQKGATVALSFSF